MNRIAATTYHESIEPFAYADGNDLVVRLRIGKNIALKVDVIHFDKFAQKETIKTSEAALFSRDGSAHVMFQARLSRDTKRFKYFFRIEVATGIVYFGREGITPEEPVEWATFEVPYLGERDRFNPPEWTKGARYYQIFPERFNRSKDSSPRDDLVNWDDVPTPFSFFGGDLPGILEKLDHLTTLGINVLYMTPVFEAPSNHKYDTVDYLKVDPSFGSEQDLKNLVQACHDRGIRVVLDAVFNHMGYHNRVFQDLIQNGEQSPYKDWIYPKSWPLSQEERNYETFGYVANMPKWRTATPEVEDYLCKVGEYWIEKVGIDGWRLDVSDEVEHRFWKHFRDRVKSVDADALICGEIWQIATPWLRGDEFDAVMNYPLGRAILDWIAKDEIDAKDFDYSIERIRSLYPEPVLHTLWNLLDSHDTPRLLTICGGDIRRVKLASFLQFMFVGSPLIYYGDEVGMTGGNDPLCRGGMIWDEDKQNKDLLQHYQTLAALRKDHPVLEKGDLRPLLQNRYTNLYAFMRFMPQDPEQVAVCLVNNGSRQIRIQLIDSNLPQGTYQLAYGQGSTLIATGDFVTIKPRSALLLTKKGD